jgi:8-oxo-dGTP pyrophosphatase MutT (NUDIX family)
MTNIHICPLCRSQECVVFANRKDVAYYRCQECALVFMGREWLPSIQVECERYEQHNNDGNDPGYVAHLMDIGHRAMRVLPLGAAGLDYGCGPTPVMGEEMEKSGFSCESYDPIFANDVELLRQKYDFITCCEAMEHFHRPEVEFTKLYNLLNDDGVLAFKTSLLDEDADFQTWYYANDWTHVSFFSEGTFDWLAKRYGLDILEREGGRIVFKKCKALERIPVVAGVISKDGRLLVAKRSSGSMAGRWEFPGGKVSGAESDAEALIREFLEEMELTIEPGRTLAVLDVPLSGKCIELRFVAGEALNEPGRLTDHSEYRWVTTAECAQMDMANGDAAFVEMFIHPA